MGSEMCIRDSAYATVIIPFPFPLLWVNKMVPVQTTDSWVSAAFKNARHRRHHHIARLSAVFVSGFVYSPSKEYTVYELAT